MSREGKKEENRQPSRSQFLLTTYQGEDPWAVASALFCSINARPRVHAHHIRGEWRPRIRTSISRTARNGPGHFGGFFEGANKGRKTGARGASESHPRIFSGYGDGDAAAARS